MNNKKLILLFILVIIFLALVIGIFYALNFRKDEDTISKSRLEFMRQRLSNIERINNGSINMKYTSNVYSDEFIDLNYDERENADERIDYILSLINNRDVSTFFDNLNSQYRYIRFGTLELFTEFFDKTFPKTVSKYTSNGFELTSNAMYINICDDNDKVVAELKTKLDLTTAKENIGIMFGRISSMEKAKFLYTDKKMWIDCNNFLIYKNRTSAILYLINYTQKDIVVDFDNTKIVKAYGQSSEESLKNLAKEPVTIPANGTAVYELVFPYMYPIPKYIDFDMTIDGERVTKRIIATQSVDYD